MPTDPETPTASDELVERVAAAMCNADTHGTWEQLSARLGINVKAARYRRFAREAIALIEAEARADERRKIADEIMAARAAYERNIRAAAGLGDAAPLVNVASQYADGMRRAAEIARGDQP